MPKESGISWNYETCRASLENLSAWYKSQVNQDNRNEASTRLHLIDILLFDCLGWDRQEDCQVEEPHGNEYADYSLFCPRRALILEAKREGVYFELPAGHKRLDYSLKALCRDEPQIKKAIEQAMGYCQGRGTALGAVCNGHQLICFVACRDDGNPPLEGNAVIFDSLERMVEDFLILWKYLSKPGVQEKNLQKHLLGTMRPVLPAKLSAQIPSYPGIKGRNLMQTDLQIVGEVVIGDIGRIREIETDFMKQCFCSSGALSDYALVSKRILQSRYAALFDAESPGPTLVPATTKRGIKKEMFAETLSGRPIILLGDVGVGKSMFIRNLIKVAGVEVMEDAIVLYVDLGTQATLTPDLRAFLLGDMGRQLISEYQVDIEERNFVRGVYHLELIRFSGGIHGDLKDSDPAAYRRKEIEFLETRVHDRESHLKASLNHLSKGRRKQIVLFLDNADQREESTQEQVFIIAQELAAHWPLTVFFPIRPQTFHRSKKLGPLSAYHPKAFTIAPPRVDEVIKKRLLFALKIAKGELQVRSISSVTLKLHQLEKYLNVLLYSFKENKKLVEFIDNVCRGNVRLVLEFVTTFIGSGHVDTKKILEIDAREEQVGGHYLIPLHEFLRAVIYGDNEHYDPQRSPISNVLDVTTPDGKEHFLVPILIDYISRATSFAGVEGFVESSDIFDYTQGAGFTESQITSALGRALQDNLVEAEARRTSEGDGPEALPRLFRATTAGVYHIARLIRAFTYVDAVVVDTPILDADVRGKITDVSSIDNRLSRATTFCEYLAKQWTLVDEKAVSFSWANSAEDLSRDIENIRRRVDSRQAERNNYD
ncbi:MAG: hypothetical protein WBD64_11770 [Candidatus Zixiibacteriota bacterium]